MMKINLTWDLFIIVFFIIILSYSFIIGKSQTIKLIVSSYLSLITADAIGNLIDKFILKSTPLVKAFDVTSDSESLIVLKISLFVLFMVVFAVQGNFDITSKKEEPLIEFFLTLLFGALSAVFIISGILVFASGDSFIIGSSNVSPEQISTIFDKSYLVQSVVLNFNWWFSLPVITLFLMSILKDKGDEEDE